MRIAQEQANKQPELEEARQQAADTIAGALTRFVETSASMFGTCEGFNMEWLSGQTTDVLARAAGDKELSDAITRATKWKR